MDACTARSHVVGYFRDTILGSEDQNKWIDCAPKWLEDAFCHIPKMPPPFQSCMEEIASPELGWVNHIKRFDARIIPFSTRNIDHGYFTFLSQEYVLDEYKGHDKENLKLLLTNSSGAEKFYENYILPHFRWKKTRFPPDFAQKYQDMYGSKQGAKYIVSHWNEDDMSKAYRKFDEFKQKKRLSTTDIPPTAVPLVCERAWMGDDVRFIILQVKYCVQSHNYKGGYGGDVEEDSSKEKYRTDGYELSMIRKMMNYQFEEFEKEIPNMVESVQEEWRKLVLPNNWRFVEREEAKAKVSKLRSDSTSSRKRKREASPANRTLLDFGFAAGPSHSSMSIAEESGSSVEGIVDGESAPPDAVSEDDYVSE